MEQKIGTLGGGEHMKKYKCPCCGYFTFESKPDGNYDICHVCFWEDDPMAYDDPYEECCCNQVSLNQAKHNYAEFGACHKDMISHVRKPNADELTGIE